MTFTAADWVVLWPLAMLAVSAVVAMVGIGVARNRLATLLITEVGLAGCMALLWPAARETPRAVTPLLQFDGFALFFIGIIAAAAGMVALFAYDYLAKTEARAEEFFVLLQIATLGSAVLAAANHFASFFLGLEILSVALYGLAAYLHRRPLPLEAGIKYLVLASASAAFLLFGMALVYMATGTLDFAGLAGALPAAPGTLILPGAALILVGIGFKLGLVPFHLWTPDVYQGAPAPVTAFIATASKAGMFAVLIRFFYVAGGSRDGRALTIITVLAIASMVAGNLLALRQRNVKRLLAYSSIAHMGYLLVAFEAASASYATAAAAVEFYFLAYFVTTLAAFGIIAALATRAGEPEDVTDYRGLFWQRPWLALTFAAMLLSLAGIPLTAGFIAKFYIVAAGANAELWLLLLVLIVTSVVGLYYYLRVVLALFATPDEAEAETEAESAPAGAVVIGRALPGASAWTLGVLLVALVWIGIYPQPFLRLILALPLR